MVNKNSVVPELAEGNRNGFLVPELVEGKETTISFLAPLSQRLKAREKGWGRNLPFDKLRDQSRKEIEVPLTR